MSERIAILRCDATRRIGGGHVARCLAIADTLADAGWRCAFWTSPESASIVPSISRHGFLPVDNAGGFPESCDLLVVDHYAVGIDDERKWRERAGCIAVIDDLADRPHDCDILIDTGPGRSVADYFGLLPSTARTVFGPLYAPVRREFLSARNSSLAARSSTVPPEPLLSICLGASDPHRLSSRLVDLAAKRLPNWRIEAVVSSDQRPSLRPSLAARRANITLMECCLDMASQLSASTLAIGAGGIGTWERCTLGVPSAVVVTADNQRANVRGAEHAGACCSLGDWLSADDARWGDVIFELANDASRLRAMSQAAAAMCDGLGTERIAALLGGLALRTPSNHRTSREHASSVAGTYMELSISEMGSNDCRQIFEWQREPTARSHSRNPRPPTWEEHVEWFGVSLLREDRWVGIISQETRPVGMIRLDWHPASHWFEISILLDRSSRGCGVGRSVLGAVREQLRDATLLAEVSPSNHASQRAFAAAGFAKLSPSIFISRIQP